MASKDLRRTSGRTPELQRLPTESGSTPTPPTTSATSNAHPSPTQSGRAARPWAGSSPQRAPNPKASKGKSAGRNRRLPPPDKGLAPTVRRSVPATRHPAGGQPAGDVPGNEALGSSGSPQSTQPNASTEPATHAIAVTEPAGSSRVAESMPVTRTASEPRAAEVQGSDDRRQHNKRAALLAGGVAAAVVGIVAAIIVAGGHWSDF